MSYLYINFLDNMERGSKSWEDFYTTSLSEQFDILKRKLVGQPADSLQSFIEMAFPSQVNKNYYISMPSFDRRMKENYRGKLCVNNIVIRPEKDSYLNYIIPSNYDLIIIGDLTFENVISITVKGIELIDSNVAKFGEKRISCVAACAFGKKDIINRNTGNVFSAPDYGTRDLHDAVLTNDFVKTICDDLYPISNSQVAIKVFNEWCNYVQFRKYYLGRQSERCEELAGYSVCDSYMVTKEAYRKNEDKFSSLLLDGIDSFAKGEQVILSKAVEGADSFPLIRIDIERNRKSVLSDTYGKSGKGKPKFEAHLQRYSKESMSLSPNAPKYDEEGNLPKGFRFTQYILGERYLFSYVDLPLDFSDLDKSCEKEIKASFLEIDNRYSLIKASELKRYIDAREPSIRKEYDSKAISFEKELDAALEKDVEENKDKEIKREFDSKVARLTAPLLKEYNLQKEKTTAAIKKVNESKLSKEEKEEKIEELRSSIEWVSHEYFRKCEEIKNGIQIRDFYIARNESLIDSKKKSLIIEMQSIIEELRREKQSELDLQYKSVISNEKNAIETRLKNSYQAKKEERIESDTIRRYQIYFRPADITDKISEIEKAIEILTPRYLTYDNRAEKAKIERQDKALSSLLGGYVKNPFLPAYLFAPESLAQATRPASKDPEWCLESLNDRQKLAVKRALASESLFLLQGPPGTGKTQVIAEITAQFTKQGKKVLISSETHKAIDNVFERLPKIPEIRPLRLIPSQNGKETNFSPERLVDNFYANISGNLNKQVNRFEHFEETKVSFDDNMKQLRGEYDKLLRIKKENIKIEQVRSRLIDKINSSNIVLESIRAELNEQRELLEQYRRTIKYIEAYRFVSEGAKEEYISLFKSKMIFLLSSLDSLKSLPIEKVQEILSVNIDLIRKEIAAILSDDKISDLKYRQQELRSILQGLRDPDTDEAPEFGSVNYDSYKAYQNELKTIVSSIKEIQSNSSIDLSSSAVFSLVPSIANNKELLKLFADDLTAFRVKTQSLVAELKASIEKDAVKYQNQEAELESKISDIRLEISKDKSLYEELSESSGIEEYGELNSSLKQQITRFFRDFGIIQEYDSDNLETAFKIISEEWNKLERDYKSTQTSNNVKIPMYREICKYLSQEDILEEDRQAYTRELYNCVNVFGITCTSRDRFTKSQLVELGKYGIESVDIRTQGIDVVIIDEVSKSSFLDLLIPILYGKTVILVGDHRQLPPMYDLRHMRADDFEGLDESIISKEINDKYTALYEECFFKTLYERVPEDFRVMLNKQYRCHSHIMEVFNHFYGGNKTGLMIGKQQQDDEKEHNLTVRIKGATVIEPKHHIYFVDCDQKESSAYEGSTSKINEQEADVVMALLKELDASCLEQVKAGKFKVDKDKRIDERPSVGVICTYGDQAGKIKKKRKCQQFNGFSSMQDERLVISTVDDFQGDERDIIIVSMVRNPVGNRYDADFIKKFERINVALSRARKLLIIVGSKKFLSEAGVIDLPDMEGNHALDKVNFHVYKEIIDTIYFRGRVLTANDIIGG